MWDALSGLITAVVAAAIALAGQYLLDSRSTDRWLNERRLEAYQRIDRQLLALREVTRTHVDPEGYPQALWPFEPPPGINDPFDYDEVEPYLRELEHGRLVVSADAADLTLAA